uniref:G-protein coupled receptors family 1 profile domain-containing protein n=1 Tax=Globodera rostochiensis TaxID=31243 RepID=A0A914HZH1_GLORO
MASSVSRSSPPPPPQIPLPSRQFASPSNLSHPKSVSSTSLLPSSLHHFPSRPAEAVLSHPSKFPTSNIRRINIKAKVCASMSPWVLPPTTSPSPLTLPPGHSLLLSALSVFLFALLISLAFSGNSLVIAAIFYDRKLRRQPENLFLVSLAVSDLFVSGLVMVFAAANDLLGHWPFGAVFCQFWICVDITCCTASILNLCAIALDRFVHISRPMRYTRFINRRVICWAICAIWLLSAFVGTAQIAFGAMNKGGNGEDGQRDGRERGNKDIERKSQCQLSLSPSYAVFSSLLSFFLPATLMLFLYSKLYMYARKHARSIQAQLKQATSLLILQLASDRVRQVVVRPSSEMRPAAARTALHCAASIATASEATPPTSVANGTYSNGESFVSVAAKREADSALVDATFRQGTPVLNAILRTTGPNCPEADANSWNDSNFSGKKLSNNNNNNNPSEHNAALSPITSPQRGAGGGRSLSSDQKARVTLGVIMGTFLLCWTPFFVVNVWWSLQPQLFPPLLFQAVTWLGYANSSLNPVIYGIFNRDFRRAFSRIVAKLLHCLREERFSPRRRKCAANLNNNSENNNGGAKNGRGWQSLRLLLPNSD